MRDNCSRNSFDTTSLCGLPLSSLTTEEYEIFLIEHLLESKRKKANQGAENKNAANLKSAKNLPMLITYINAHCLNLSFENKAYRDTLLKCDLLYADGQAVVWASAISDKRLPERVNAGDFILDFFRRCANKDIKVFLLGSYQEVIINACKNFSEKIHGLKIVGIHNGFFSEDDNENILAEINSSGADLLIVGMSAPRQEIWSCANLDRLNVGAVWCVGALFEYYSGIRKRCPVWMRKAGLEWLFRLALEPGRLWRRYLIGNILFIVRILKWRLTKKK